MFEEEIAWTLLDQGLASLNDYLVALRPYQVVRGAQFDHRNEGGEHHIILLRVKLVEKLRKSLNIVGIDLWSLPIVILEYWRPQMLVLLLCHLDEGDTNLLVCQISTGQVLGLPHEVLACLTDNVFQQVFASWQGYVVQVRHLGISEGGHLTFAPRHIWLDVPFLLDLNIVCWGRSPGAKDISKSFLIERYVSFLHFTVSHVWVTGWDIAKVTLVEVDSAWFVGSP